MDVAQLVQFRFSLMFSLWLQFWPEAGAEDKSQIQSNANVILLINQNTMWRQGPPGLQNTTLFNSV